MDKGDDNPRWDPDDINGLVSDSDDAEYEMDRPVPPPHGGNVEHVDGNPQLAKQTTPNQHRHNIDNALAQNYYQSLEDGRGYDVYSGDRSDMYKYQYEHSLYNHSANNSRKRRQMQNRKSSAWDGRDGVSGDHLDWDDSNGNYYPDVEMVRARIQVPSYSEIVKGNLSSSGVKQPPVTHPHTVGNDDDYRESLDGKSRQKKNTDDSKDGAT